MNVSSPAMKFAGQQMAAKHNAGQAQAAHQHASTQQAGAPQTKMNKMEAAPKFGTGTVLNKMA